MGFILENLKNIRKNLIVYFFLALVGSLAGYCVPIILSRSVGSGIVEARFMVWQLLTLFAISILANLIMRFFIMNSVSRFSLDLLSSYFDRFQRIPISKLNEEHTGNLISRTSRVTSYIDGLIFQSMWNVTSIIVGIAILIPTVFRQSVIAGISCAGLFMLFLTTCYFLTKQEQKIVSALNKTSSACWERITDFVMNLKTVKRLRVYHYAANKLKDSVSETKLKVDKYFRFEALMWLTLDLILFAAFGSAMFSAIVQAGDDANKLLTSIIFYGTMFQALKGSLMQFANLMSSVMRLFTNSSDLEELIGQHEDLREPKETWRQIEVKDLRFRHKGSSQKIEVPSFSVTKGEKICITGESGEGKTTFLKLLAGEVESNLGKILIDGIPSASRPAITFVTQDVEMFNTTLEDNICLGNEVTKQRLWQLLADAGLDEWVNDLEDGLQTKVGERGLKLSEGQKERINLIRGLLLDGDIYILDEPTAHLDPSTEMSIIKMIEKHLKDKTVIIVTHKPALTEICSARYEFKDGKMLKVS